MSTIAKDRNSTTFGKAASVLRAVITHQGSLTLKELAQRAGIPVSTTHRILEDLELEGWIVQERESCMIEAGASLLSIAASIMSRYGVERVVRPVLRRLVDATGETVCLNLIDRSSLRLVTYVVEESRGPLGYHLTAGDISYLHAGASGRAVLAFLSPAEIREVIRRVGLPRMTADTITSASKLQQALAEVRKSGYAFSRGERLTEAVGIAAPVFAANDLTIGSLLVTIPNFRFTARKRAAFARGVMRSAQDLRQVVDPLLRDEPK